MAMAGENSSTMAAREQEVFICYRRQDTQSIVGRLYADLAGDLGRNRVFKDTDSIPAAVPFPEHVATVLARCRVVLVVIGHRWLDATAGEQRSRLFDEGDHVRAEIKAAQAAGAIVLPVFYAGAEMPRREVLPKDLEALVQLNGRPLREDPDYERDYDGLCRWIRSELTKKRATMPKVSRFTDGRAPVHGPSRLGAALAIVAIVSIVAVVSAVTYRRIRTFRPIAPAPVRTTPPVSMRDRLKKIEVALEDGNTTSARLTLEHELSESPRDGRIPYMLGRVAFAEGKHVEALAHYREAIGLDAGFRGDPVVLGHVAVALDEPPIADLALTFAIEKIGLPATELLTAVANNSTDLARRERAAAGIEALGQGNKIDRVGLTMLHLKKALSCQEKKVFVEKLRDLGDPRALPALRALRGRNVGDIFRIGGVNTSCMKTELPAAIKELEAAKDDW